jgi:hypothetical protein
MLQITVVVEVPPAAFTVRYAVAEATSGQALAVLVSMRDEISASSKITSQDTRACEMGISSSKILQAWPSKVYLYY